MADEYKAPTEAEWAALQAEVAELRGRAGKATEPEPARAGGSSAADRERRALERAAAAVLIAAGFTGTPARARRVAATFDLSSIDPDDDLAEELDDQIDSLKGELPALFATEPAVDESALGYFDDDDEDEDDEPARPSRSIGERYNLTTASGRTSARMMFGSAAVDAAGGRRPAVVVDAATNSTTERLRRQAGLPPLKRGYR